MKYTIQYRDKNKETKNWGGCSNLNFAHKMRAVCEKIHGRNVWVLKKLK